MARKTVAKVAAFTLIGAASLDKEMKSIVTAVGKLDDRIQLYLLSELAHIAEHKNPTRLNSFFNAMKGKGTRVTAMSAYVQKFGTLKYDAERVNKETNEKGMFVYSDHRKYDLETAKSRKWYDEKPEQALKSFDMSAQITRILQSAVNHAANAERANLGDKIDMELVQKLIDLGFKVDMPKADAPKAEAPAEKLEAAN